MASFEGNSDQSQTGGRPPLYPNLPSAYADGMSEPGYDDLLFLRDASEADIDELIGDVRMKKGHAKKFKLEWKALSGR